MKTRCSEGELSCPVSPVLGGRGRRLVERSTLGLEFDELARHVVAAPVRQDPQHGPAGLVEVNAARQRAPERAAGPLDDVAHLKHGQADDTVLPGETVVANTQVKFIQVRVRLASQRTASHHHNTRSFIHHVQFIINKAIVDHTTPALCTPVTPSWPTG